METTGECVTVKLAFARLDGATKDFWAPDRTGAPWQQNARGRDYAGELLVYLRKERNPALVGSVIRAIVGGGVYGPVEIGFCNALGVELLGLAAMR